MSELKIVGPRVEGADHILTSEALSFVADLHERFAARRNELLALRKSAREQASKAGKLDFLPETADVRAGQWSVGPIPADLADRRVEITGPTERKMTINALNSGAKVWLADLEDANTPHWGNVVSGQVNLYDAVRGTISLDTGAKQYALNPDVTPAVIVMRPRGWHLDEQHVVVDDAPGVGCLVDFGLYFFHNAKALLAKGSGPYFYLPKMESHLEARLWNDVFVYAQETLGIPQGSVKATVLIETIPAAFQMEEIIYELRAHLAGLNAGRWDYLFSIIKYFRDAGSEFVLPDRNSITMTVPFMRAYTELLVRTCHKRGAQAIGGMAAFIPNRRDPEVTEQALAKVRADKTREAGDGFDGSWVAHPDLVPVCREVFDAVLGDKPNQLDRLREDVAVKPEELINFAAAEGKITEVGLRAAIDVGVRYLVSWLSGNGAAAIHNLMEDAATAEISRSQVWQWVYNGVSLDTGKVVTKALVLEVLAEVKTELGVELGTDCLDVAARLFEQVALAADYADFLTTAAYGEIVNA
jgi:malate synthase